MSYESMMMKTMTRHNTTCFFGGIGSATALGRAVSFSAQICAQRIRMYGTAPIFVGAQGSSVPIGWRLQV
jgi:hypothetical protein